MTDQNKSKDELISELQQLRGKVKQLQKDEQDHPFTQSLIEVLPVPIAILKASKNGDGYQFTYEFVNQAIADINNKSIKEHIGHSLDDIIEHKPAAQNIQQNFERVLLDGKTSVREIDMPFQGRIGRLKEYHFPINHLGKNPRVGVALLDITELTEALKTSENANHAKSKFLSHMSHELRTPLNSILGFAQILQKRISPEENQRQADCVKRIVTSGHHLLHLIEDILDLSKIESGLATLDIQDITVNTIVGQCIEDMTPLATASNISILPPEGDDLQAYVRADYARLTQALLNIMSNAIKYNQAHGSVSIHIMKLPDKLLRISVHDTGIGIADKNQIDLFHSFNRLGMETSAISGTGIGLVIAKKHMQAMDGNIGYTSKKDVGSQFWVDIPLSTTQNGNLPKSQSLQEKETEKTVLYIEDNPTDALLMQMLLESYSAEVRLIVAPNAELGLKIAKSTPPDLILLDIRLPGINGLEALKYLQETEETKGIPVIAVTAEATARDIRLGEASGFYAYFTKPYSLQEMIDTITKAIGVTTRN